jgi:hypothetical protein
MPSATHDPHPLPPHDDLRGFFGASHTLGIFWRHLVSMGTLCIHTTEVSEAPAKQLIHLPVPQGDCHHWRCGSCPQPRVHLRAGHLDLVARAAGRSIAESRALRQPSPHRARRPSRVVLFSFYSISNWTRAPYTPVERSNGEFNTMPINLQGAGPAGYTRVYKPFRPVYTKMGSCEYICSNTRQCTRQLEVQPAYISINR